jgi:hypothetical protein
MWNDEEGWVVAYINILCQHSHGRTEENHKKSFSIICVTVEVSNFKSEIYVWVRLLCNKNYNMLSSNGEIAACKKWKYEYCKKNATWQIFEPNLQSERKAKLSLCLTNHCAMKAYLFMTSALVGGEWLASRPGLFTPGESDPRTHWIGGWVGRRALLDYATRVPVQSKRSM